MLKKALQCSAMLYNGNHTKQTNEESKMKYESKVKKFKAAIDKREGDLRAAALLAHKKYGLNAADSSGGLGSDQAAWIEAQK